MYQQALSEGGVAVVTGAASGVGLIAAKRFAAAGLNVLLADLPSDGLEEALQIVRDAGVANNSVEVLPTDVSDYSQVEMLAKEAKGMGPIAVLMNNAGIGLPTKSWNERDNWRQTIEVNFFGVLNGIQAFIPSMIDANRPAVVINTGSKQGITTPPGNPAYNVSKAAVKVLTEQLSHDLREAGAPISAHLFVPGFTYTGKVAKWFSEKPAGAWTSEQTVDHFIERMSAGDFYILCPDNDVDETKDKKRVAWAMGDIVENRPALSRWHADFKDIFAKYEAGEKD